MFADQISDQHAIFHGRDGQIPPGTAKAMSMRQVTVDFAISTLTESGSVDLWGDTNERGEETRASAREPLLLKIHCVVSKRGYVKEKQNETVHRALRASLRNAASTARRRVALEQTQGKKL